MARSPRPAGVEPLEAELERARALDVDDLADAIRSIGFECTRCGACCKAEQGCGSDGSERAGDDPADDGTVGQGDDPPEATDDDEAGDDPHTATVFPDEVRRLQDAAGDGYDWRDVARPTPFGLDDDGEGETFEWALAVDDCGDCSFYEERDGVGACTVHGDRPLICRTYPFSVAGLGDEGGLGTTEPMGGVVDSEGVVRAHECEGLGREISRADAEELAAALKERAVRELEEAIGVRDSYRPVDADGTVVYDSEGPKRADGTPIESGE